METALIIFLIILANITIYWAFIGQKKFNEKLGLINNNHPNNNHNNNDVNHDINHDDNDPSEQKSINNQPVLVKDTIKK
ncbi:hypothetical protein J4437_06140 [Candidatus Woesearchaeota archaeon]|nr:hypothetical protein [Candidatus Woesearchaeota archaeon]